MPEKPMQETDIERLMKHLGESISETLAESPKISDRIQEIRDAGYEVFIVIEAKIGFSSTGKEDRGGVLSNSDEPVRLKVNSDDVKFLNSLKISAE